MGFFLSALLFVGFFVLSELLKPKPKTENARPATLNDFNFPTATEGRVIPVIWGTVKLSGPNVVWYGDFRQDRIRKKQKTGLFSSKKVTVGYKYYLGLQMALCRGPLNSLLRIWVGENEVYNGTLAGGAEQNIDLPELFGGDELGSGGISGVVKFYDGDSEQDADDYLAQYQQQDGVTPTYGGTSYVVCKGMYLGNSTSIEPWAFELRRIPTYGSYGSVNDGNDANTAVVLYELLTNTEWGLGFSESDIDMIALQNAMITCQLEGNGISLILDQTTEIQDLVREIERQMDGVVYMDRSTGKWTVKLARGDYDLDTIPHLNEDNIIEVKDFSRGAWEDTVNEVRVPFVDRSRDYFDTSSMAQDMANIRIQQTVVPATQSYPGVKDKTLANYLAWRDLKTMSFPLCRATLVCDRTAAGVNPGDVIAWTDVPLGFQKMAMRVQRVDLGELVQGRVTLKLVQDIFFTSTPVFSAPPATGWQAPTGQMVNIPDTSRVIFEAPKAIVDRAPENPGQAPRVWCGVRNMGDGAVQYYINIGGYNVALAEEFAIKGKLATNATANHNGSLTIEADLDTIAAFQDKFNDEAITTTEMGESLLHLMLVGDEFVSFQSYTVVGSTLVLNNCYRGLLDSTAKAWPAGTAVWFLAGEITASRQTGSTATVKPLTESTFDTLSLAEATSTLVTFQSRYYRPYPPSRIKINGVELAAAATTNVAVSGGDGTGLFATFNRRDHRLVDEVVGCYSEAANLSDFPTALNTRYVGKIYADPDGTLTPLFTTDHNSGSDTVNFHREKIVRYNGGNLPARVRVGILARHTISGVDFEALKYLEHDFNLSDSQLSGSFNAGVVGSGAYTTAFVAGVTGSYSAALGQSVPVGSKIVYSLNGAADVDFITAGSSGAVLALTAGDSVRFKSNMPGTTAETLFRFFSGSDKMHAVFLRS